MMNQRNYLEHANTENKSTKINEIHFINNDIEIESNIVSIKAFKNSTIKYFFYIFFSIITGGLFYLFCRWRTGFNLSMKYTESILEEADILLIESADQTSQEIKLIHRFRFEYRLQKYSFNHDSKRFEKIKFSLEGIPSSDIHKRYSKGHNQESLKENIEIFGKNETKLKMEPMITILLNEILSPFYIFQAFAIILWFNNTYYFFATFILFSSFISIGISYRDYKRNFQRLQEMSDYEIIVEVHRNIDNVAGLIFDFKKISSSDLVPGDLIKIPNNKKMPCDIVLLNGSAIVNESVLTGESIPVKKSELPQNSSPYSIEDSKRNTLFAGTKCIETRSRDKSEVYGVVTSIGFNTIKGSLIRSILFTPNTDFKFYNDALKFVFCMFIIALVGMLYSLIILLDKGAILKDIILQSLDIITITVPPALPICMSFGITIALARLKEKDIYSISPLKINVAGKINLFCFDKTGSLTENDLDPKGVVPVSNKKLMTEVEISDLNDSNLLEILASCHSLTKVENQLLGDPLDIKMFESTGWELIENENEENLGVEATVSDPKKPNHRISIVKRNDFSSKLQRMSVVVKSLIGYDVFVKGSPEKISELCKKETIPENFHEVLDLYAKVFLFLIILVWIPNYCFWKKENH